MNINYKKPNYNSDSRVFSENVFKYIGGSQDSKSNLNNNKLNNRIKNFWKLRKRLFLLNKFECLEKKVFNVDIGYTIRNIINLEKQIGHKSLYGKIYLTSIPNFHITYPIATKVMKFNDYNIREVDLMRYITYNILLKKLSKHFLMMYGYCICNKSINENLRLISINELADDDLKTILDDKFVINDNELILNILFQTFISIATFHITVGFIHKDTHHKNFLCKKNNEIGYYHYVFNNKDYYLKSCKYNIIIYDYGFAIKNNTIDNKKRKRYNKYIWKDYKKICNAFINKKNGGWIHSSNLPDTNITTIIKNVKKILMNSMYLELNNIKNYSKDKLYSERIFTYIIENIFLKYTPNGMFITNRPPNIINDIPFIIG
jgi:hypothetical protein